MKKRIENLQTKLEELLCQESFPLNNARNLPEKPGVYVLHLSDADTLILYVGQTDNIVRRIRAQIVEGTARNHGMISGIMREKRCDVREARSIIRKLGQLRWLPMENSDEKERKELEYFAYAVLQPKFCK